MVLSKIDVDKLLLHVFPGNLVVGFVIPACDNV